MKYINTFKLFEAKLTEEVIPDIKQYDIKALKNLKATLKPDSDAAKLLDILNRAIGKTPISTRAVTKEINKITAEWDDQDLATDVYVNLFNAAEMAQHLKKAQAKFKPQKDRANAYMQQGLNTLLTLGK